MSHGYDNSNSHRWLINGSIIDCYDDLDCPYSSICYYNITFKFNGKADPWRSTNTNPTTNIYRNVCGCDSQFGEMSSRCDAYSPYKLFFIISSALAMVYCVFVTFVVILPLLYHLIMETKVKIIDFSVVTLVQSIGVFVSIFFVKLGIFLNRILNDKFVLVYNPIIKKHEKYRLYDNLTIFGSASAVFFVGSSMMNIGLVWLDVARSSRRFRYSFFAGTVSRCRLFVISSNFLLLMSMIIIGSIQPFVTSILVTPFLFLFLFIYSYGAFQISRALRETVDQEKSTGRARSLSGTASTLPRSSFTDRNSEDLHIGFEKMRIALKRIKTAAIWLVISDAIFLIFLMLFIAYYRSSVRVILPGDPFLPLIYIDIAFAAFISLSTSIVWYVYMSSRRKPVPPITPPPVSPPKCEDIIEQ